MRFGSQLRAAAGALFLLLAFVVAPSRLAASHGWGSYHWATDGDGLVLAVGDNVSGEWDQFLDLAVADWNSSRDLTLAIVPGTTRPRQCKPTAGRIEVCSESYGNNGWLGIASIWVSGTHIVQATTKVNDYYYAIPFYDTYEWRRFVMCQEIGHDFGLSHQDEDFDNPNIGTCMDYTSDPGGALPGNVSNLTPDSHDFDQLASMYSHTDGGGGGGAGPGGGRGRGSGPAAAQQAPGQVFLQALGDEPSAWGQLVRSNGQFAMYLLDFGNGRRVFTFVIWA